jgi:GPH family glycoside/pentoside/hexuronide:cation symporter
MDSATLIGYIGEARQAVGNKVPIGTVEPDKTLLQHPEIMKACDVVLANIPPISYGIPPARALAYVQTTWQQISSLSGGHEVQIGETEWASDGVRPLVKVFYFEGFDEPWLASTDTVGPHWGIFTNTLMLKPGFEPVFQK